MKTMHQPRSHLVSRAEREEPGINSAQVSNKLNFLSPLKRCGQARRDIAQFNEDGFLIIESAIRRDWAEEVAASVAGIFAGRFDTGSFPDSWMWQEGHSFPNLQRTMANAWKCNLGIANMVLAEPFAAAACRLMGWNGARLAVDSLWLKPPGSDAGGYHRDEMLMFAPSETCSCWITLDDVVPSVGTLEYAVGSHRWPDVEIRNKGQHVDPYHDHIAEFARRIGHDPVFHHVTALAGSVSFHHGRLFHASLENQSDRPRRAVSIHFINEDAVFSDSRRAYVLGRYKMTGTHALDENFRAGRG